MNPNLLLYRPLVDSATPLLIQNFTSSVVGWKRSIRALGGYWLGSFALLGTDISRQELIKWFRQYLGSHVEEKTFGLTSWEGLIYEMTLTLDGMQYRRTLDKEWFHNKVKVLFQNANVQTETSWSENTDSSDEYGEVQYIDVIGEATATEAIALRDTRLENFGTMRPRMVGGLEFGNPSKEGGDSLAVTVAGYVFTLNWRYRETDIEGTAASSAISTLVGDSEFVSAGTIDTNSLSVDLDCSTPKRLWDAMIEIIARGDGDGAIWVGGVYADRQFNYNLANVSEIKYYIRDKQIVDCAGAPIVPSLMEADFVVQNMNMLIGW